MNLYTAPDSYYDGSGTWTPQQVTAPSLKAARKVLPHGKHRRIVLTLKNINRPPTVTFPEAITKGRV